MALARVNHAAVVVRDGHVVVVGGANLTSRYCALCYPMGDVEVYDPSAAVWSVATPMDEAPGNPTAVRLADGGGHPPATQAAFAGARDHGRVA